jgi:Ca2+-binding EF-hand superfamily protein
MFDADGSGTIDLDELIALAKELGSRLSRAEAEAVMAEIDTDCSGEIDVEEFSVWWGKSQGAGGGLAGDFIRGALRSRST